MSSRREVLIRILALLQRKTLLKTKNRTLKCKCLKRHYSTVQSMRNVGVDGGRGFCPLFSSPPRGIWQLNSPHPRPLPFKAKKLLMPGGQPGGRLGAAGIDWCIIYATFAAALSLQISLIVRFDSNVKKEIFRCQFSMQKFKLKYTAKRKPEKNSGLYGISLRSCPLPLSVFFFLSSQRSKEAKKVAPDLRLVRDSNPWPLRYQCSAIPIDHSRKEAAASFLKHLEDPASCWRAWKKVEKEGKKVCVDFKIRIFVVFTGNYWRGSWSTGDVSITRKLIKVRNAVWWKFVDFSLTTTLIWVSFPFSSLCG